MNSYDSQGVRSRFPTQTLGFLTNVNGKTRLNPSRVAMAFRKLVFAENHSPDDPATLKLAQDPSRHAAVNPRLPFETLNWGTFTMLLSELGKTKELNDLLEYADEKLNPTWENGGLFYPRNDELADEEWNLTHVEPHSGNSGIAYARLNVEDGQKQMWEHPWTSEEVRARPWVHGVEYGDGVDFLRAVWDEEVGAFVVTMRTWDREKKGEVGLVVRNLPAGRWAVYVDGRLTNAEEFGNIGDIPVTVKLGSDEIDLIVQRIE
jgi:hypothetical protein